MPRTTTRGNRTATGIDTRRAATVGLTSFATLTLIPLLTHAKPSERALLLLAAVPAAALLGCLAGYAAATASSSATRLDVGQLHATQQGIEVRAAHLQAARHGASAAVQPSAPAIELVSEPVPPSGTGSPVGSGPLAALPRPPADQHRALQQGLRLVPAPTREASGTAAGAATSRLGDRDRHLTLIVTHPTS